MEKKHEGGETKNEKVDRRRVLKMLGATGAAIVAGGLLQNRLASALPSVTEDVYGDAGAALGKGFGPGGVPGRLEALAEQVAALEASIGVPSGFRPEDADVISKLNNESVDRAVNLRWYGAVGDGVTDDMAAWDAAIAAVPAGGALFVPPGTYYSALGFACPRGDITLFGAGPSSHLVGGSQENTLLVGTADRSTRVKNVNVHSLRFTQQPGPSGSGADNNYAGVKIWYCDRAAIYNNDFENCDVGVSLAGGNHLLGFPGRVTYRNTVAMNRMLNTRKMGIEIFFQDHAFVYGNQMINENSFPAAESHAIRNIGSHHSYIVANEARRFRTGISNQGGQSNGYRDCRNYVNAHNKFRDVVKGIMGTVGTHEGQVLYNTLENVRDFGIEYRWETLSGNYVGWDQVDVVGNLIAADPNSTSSSRAASFGGGARLTYRGNRSLGFGDGMSSGASYHVFLDNITKIAVIEGNYFEDGYYVSDTDRNLGVRVRNNAKTVVSRNNVFVSPVPDPAERNKQESGSGQLLKGFAGVADMNDHLQP